MKLELASTVLASAGGFLETVDAKWRGVVAIGCALSVGFTAAIVLMVTFGDYQSLPRDVAELQEWRIAHEDTVSAPGMSLARSNQDAVQTLREDVSLIREMTFQLYCDRFPERCQAVPDNGGD